MDPLNSSTISPYAKAAASLGVARSQFENFARAGVVLQPQQLVASIQARALDTSKYADELGYGGARGGGKTHWLIAQIAVDDCQREPGLKCLILRKVGKAASESFEDFRPKILSRISHDYTIRGGVKFPNGSRILLGHFKDEGDIDAYLGLEYDVIGVEEATTLTWTKYEAIQSVNRTSRPNWVPRIYTTVNPGGVGHAWYKKRFIDDPKGRTRFVEATVSHNVFVNDGYRRRLDELTGWRRRAWLLGDWDIAVGQFFSTFRKAMHVIKPFGVPSHWRVWASLDYGYVHPTVAHLLAKDENGIIYHVDEYVGARLPVSSNADGIKAMFARNDIEVSRLSEFIAGVDVFSKRDDGPTIADKYAHEGLTLKRANMDRVNGWAEMLDRLGDVDRGIDPRWQIFNTCYRLIDTLPYLEHNPNRPEDVLKVDVDSEGNGGDDAADCARYGLMIPKQRIMKSGSVDWYSSTPPPRTGCKKTRDPPTK